MSYLLTVAIPTFNRGRYLAQNLLLLQQALAGIPAGLVEVFVSDNASEDDTQSVVAKILPTMPALRYIRNVKNIGSDANIAQCFNEAKGKYVQILGDDDFYLPGALQFLVGFLSGKDLGLVGLRAWGVEADWEKECPPFGAGEIVFFPGNELAVHLNRFMTFISGCVMNKGLLKDVDANQFCGGMLVQTHLFLLALARSQQSAFIPGCSLACKRNNSGGYDVSKVFVEELGRIFDQYLSPDMVARIESKILLSGHPYWVWRLRLATKYLGAGVVQRYEQRFSSVARYKWLVRPILVFPRSLALLYGCVVWPLGRVLDGGAARGLSFLRRSLFRKWL